MSDPYLYKGKTVVLMGSFSGMGEQAGKMLMDAGADLWALDIKKPEYKVSHFIQADLGDKKSLDNTLAQLPDTIDTVISVAGIAGNQYRGSKFSEPDVIRINYLGTRYLLENLIPRMKENGSIVATASIAGGAWPMVWQQLKPLVDLTDYDEAVQWIEANYQTLEPAFTFPDLEGGKPPAQPVYCVSKGLLCYWVASLAYGLAGKKIRINTVSPGFMETSMIADFNGIPFDAYGPFISPYGRPANPDETASAALFLGSRRADYISGIDLRVDCGVANAGMFVEA